MGYREIRHNAKRLLTHSKDLTILNVYTPNNSASKYVKQKLSDLKLEVEKSTAIVGGFNTPL